MSKPLNWDAYLERGRKEIAGVMKTEVDRSWTAHIVIASDHAGLKPYFKALENEMYRVLARTDDPKMVQLYIEHMKAESIGWLLKYDFYMSQK